MLSKTTPVLHALLCAVWAVSACAQEFGAVYVQEGRKRSKHDDELREERTFDLTNERVNWRLSYEVSTNASIE